MESPYEEVRVEHDNLKFHLLIPKKTKNIKTLLYSKDYQENISGRIAYDEGFYPLSAMCLAGYAIFQFIALFLRGEKKRRGEIKIEEHEKELAATFHKEKGRFMFSVESSKIITYCTDGIHLRFDSTDLVLTYRQYERLYGLLDETRKTFFGDWDGSLEPGKLTFNPDNVGGQ